MQINRLFEIIYILLEKKNVTAKEFAEHFEVSTRTIYRDIETLSSAGIPVYMSKGKNGGISLLSGYILNKAVLTDEEKVDILASLKAVSTVNSSRPDSAIDKLSAMFGDKNTDWIEVDFSHWSDSDKERELFNNLKTSIINRSTVVFSYSNGKGETTKREVEPLKLCFRGQDWYFYGYCRQKNDYRFFKLKRISQLTVTNNQFLRETPKQIFNPEDYHVKHPETVKLRISKQLAYRVYDEFPQYELDDNEDFIVNAVIWDKDWIYNYISTFGKMAEIIEPLAIRNKYINFLQENLKVYS